MKRIIIVFIALCAMSSLTSFIKMERIKEERSLESLWKDYEKAESGDRVQKMAQILEEIKAAALKERASWDYFKACDRYVDVVSMRNWKLRDSLEMRMRDEISEYGDPLLDYLAERGHSSPKGLVAKVRAMAESLQAGHDAELYSGRGDILNPAVVLYVRDDYEYVLWDLFSLVMYGDDELAEEVFSMLEDKSEGIYPLAGLAEYYNIVNVSPADVREELLAGLADKYEGKAVSLLAGQKLLEMEFGKNSESGDSGYFRDFERRLESYEHERSMYRNGADRIIAKDCRWFEDMLEHLRSKAVKLRVRNGMAEIAMRNLSEVKVRITRGNETVHEAVMKDPVGSFYAFDKLEMELPSLDDGDYSIACFDGRDELGRCRYPRYTLSVAVRSDKEGLGVYVADYLSGKPLESAGLELYSGDRKIAEVSDVSLDGFTPLPEELASRTRKGTSGYYLVCIAEGDDGKIRRSDGIYLRGGNGSVAASSRLSATVMPERAAFRPGESVRFKAVVYESLSDGSMEVSPARAVKVNLQDPQGNVLASIDGRTNGFGSVSGEFSLDHVRRNGVHTVQVWYGDRLIGSVPLTVDDFVLPSFNVSFDMPDRTFCTGDTVVVTGRLESFSGHMLRPASVTASVSLGDDTVKVEEVVPDEDGRFSLSFIDVGNADNMYVPYEVEVKVTDLTGETLSFFFRQPVMRRPVLRASLDNSAEGRCGLVGNRYGRCAVLTDESARISCAVSYPTGEVAPGVALGYFLERDGDRILEGSVLSGEDAEIDFSGLAAGLYRFVLTAAVAGSDGKTCDAEQELHIVKVREDSTLDPDFENLFYVASDDIPFIRFGSGCAAIWAVAEIFDGKGNRLDSGLFHLDAGEMCSLRYVPENGYPDAVTMNVLYFRNSECHSFTHVWHRPADRDNVPLEIVRLTDECVPGSSCSLSLRTDADSEVLVSVFDVSTEQVRKNVWRNVAPVIPSVFRIRVLDAAGRDGSGYESFMGDFHPMYEGLSAKYDTVVGYGSVMRNRRTKSVGAVVEAENSMDSVSMEESVSYAAPQSPAVPEVKLREDFSASLAFEPHLRPDEEGNVSLEFNVSDKISTFVVSVFAHDKSMGNAAVRREILVTMPVRLDVMQPQYLYAGDEYVPAVSVSNDSASDVKGKVGMRVCSPGPEGREAVASYVRDVHVRAGESVPVSFDLSVPSGTDMLVFETALSGICLSGDGRENEVSDGVSFRVPVYSAEQVLKESHSGVLLDGMSEEKLVEDLRKRFVNVQSAGAEYVSISVRDMLKDAFPKLVDAKGKDVVSLSEAMYVNMLSAGLRKAEGGYVRENVASALALVEKILSCANSDGGFAWFEGMKSSPVVTAVVLERYAGLRDRGLLGLVTEGFGEDSLDDFDEAAVAAVRYLDEIMFADPDRPLWYGALSCLQYLSVRSMFAGVPFDVSAARNADDGRVYREFCETAEKCLVPGKDGRWTDGSVLSKVRMIGILNSLLSSEQGMKLAEAWGLPAGRRMRRSMETELESLKEYAVEHPSGGVYYPNVVLPWRGLLESEAYAHAMICDLYDTFSSDRESGALADGIRIWMMLQKETQEWSSDPGFVEALASVYDGSDAVMDTKVIVLSKRYIKSFGDIEPSGNGFRLDVAYYRDGQLLTEGDELHVGDKVVAKYSVWSEENRSFVRLSVPRAACFRPAEQLSGWSGGWLRRVSYGPYSVAPYAYREVKTERTLYWMDVCPEENSVMEETLFVVQEGRFSCPVAEIESLYATHYRANEGSWGSFEVR